MFEVAKVKVEGIQISKYIINNGTSEKEVGYNELLSYIDNGEIRNAENINGYAVISGGIENLEVVSSIDNKKFTVISRILGKNGKCVGYKIKDSKGKQLRISINKTWELASLGCISELRAGVTNGVKTILSTNNVKLSDILCEKS